MKTMLFSVLIFTMHLVPYGNVVQAQAIEAETDSVSIKSRLLCTKLLDRVFVKLITTNAEVKALAEELSSKGFVAQREPKNFYGFRVKYKDESLNSKVIYRFQFQDYKNPNSKDIAALCYFSVNAGKEADSYAFFLLAPNGDFEQMQEFYIDKRLNILEANSWWNCTKRRVSNRCPNDCLTAFVNCIPSGTSGIVSYLACVVGKCVQCLIRAGACCACDCHWYCRFVGCCER